MKASFKTLFVLFISVLVSQAVSFSYGYSSTSTIVGDVRIQTLNNGSLYCDSIICPPETVTCKVTKQNDPNNFDIIIRHRSCLDRNGHSLAEEKINERNRYHNQENTVIISGSGFQSVQGGTVRRLTPQEQRQLEQRLRLAQEQVQTQVGSAMQRLQMEMQQFNDGTFFANLNNRIRQSMLSAFPF